jgi:hypothetical protein
MAKPIYGHVPAVCYCVVHASLGRISVSGGAVQAILVVVLHTAGFQLCVYGVRSVWFGGVAGVWFGGVAGVWFGGVSGFVSILCGYGRMVCVCVCE